MSELVGGSAASPDDPVELVHQLGLLRHHGSLSLEAPSDWFFKESITALAPDGRANVIASTEPLDPAIDVHQYANVQGDMLKADFNDYQERYFGELGVVGLPGTAYFREFSWTPPDGESVAQMQLYALIPGCGITVTGTTPAEDFDRYRDDLFALLSSVVHDVSGFSHQASDNPVAAPSPDEP